MKITEQILKDLGFKKETIISKDTCNKHTWYRFKDLYIDQSSINKMSLKTVSNLVYREIEEETRQLEKDRARNYFKF